MQLTHALFDQEPGLIYRDFGPPADRPAAPALLYLPGVQGDWTPIGRLGPLLAQRWRFVATCYPRRWTWTLDDHAAAAVDLLDKLGIARTHVLAESFGSLVGWALALRAPERVASLIIAAGFSQSPRPIGARAARHALHWIPSSVHEFMLRRYIGWVARSRIKRKPELFEQAFMAVRTRPGMRTCANRMRIIYITDLRSRLGEIKMPVGYVGGAHDHIVPVRREIATLEKMLSPACRFRSQLWPDAPHAILPARYVEVAEWIDTRISELENL